MPQLDVPFCIRKLFLKITLQTHRIQIFISLNKHTLPLKISTHTPLRGLFAIFAKSLDMEGFASLHFQYGGQRLYGEETAAELQLSDGDCIFVTDSSSQALDVV